MALDSLYSYDLGILKRLQNDDGKYFGPYIA